MGSMRANAVAVVTIVVTLGIMGGRCWGYKPVLMMHGIGFSSTSGTYHDWDDHVKWLATYHPGQITVPLDINNSLESNKPLWVQLGEIADLISSIVDGNESFAEGYHWIGHSQGGLIMRCLLEQMDHHVDQYVSYAGVQGGYYGIPDVPPKWWIENVTAEFLTEILYTDIMQNTWSVANFWRSPYYDMFLEGNSFLPVLDNLVESDSSDMYKSHFLQVGNITLFASPEDLFITPWYAELFDYYDEEYNRVDMSQQAFYTGDTFGLRTLDQTDRLHRITLNRMQHADWLHDEDVFVQYTLPLLS
ncbi:palmitoyl-protein thioesterase 2 [Pelomyxa schiedti]|nr:palmitoyl-protein thioesterase 2 [Pelomyxa schiedti]